MCVEILTILVEVHDDIKDEADCTNFFRGATKFLEVADDEVLRAYIKAQVLAESILRCVSYSDAVLDVCFIFSPRGSHLSLQLQSSTDSRKDTSDAFCGKRSPKYMIGVPLNIAVSR